MDNFDYTGYTNDKTWYKDSGLIGTGNILWLTYHEKDWLLDEIKANTKWDTAEKIFLIGQEAKIADWTKEDPRIHIWDNENLPEQERYYPFYYWLNYIRDVELAYNARAKLSNPMENPPEYIFDALMGYAREHRVFVYNSILKHDLESKILLNYIGNNYDQKWIPGTEHDTDVNVPPPFFAASVIPIPNFGYSRMASFLPYKVYNQSWFTIVTETRFHQRFITEKTAKPLAAKKLFVFFGAKHHLKDLKELGFKTFDSVIDEEYDTISDNETRWQAAFDQVQYLCNQDPAKVYTKILPILEHNQKHFFELNLLEKAFSEVKAIAYS